MSSQEIIFSGSNMIRAIWGEINISALWIVDWSWRNQREKLWITRGGWAGELEEMSAGLSLMPLEWTEGSECERHSMNNLQNAHRDGRKRAGESLGLKV